MSAAEQKVTDLEIHGYLDGELAENRLSTVESYLDENRTAAERLVHYGIQGDLIRRLYGPLISRPMPDSILEQLQAMAASEANSARSSRKGLTVTILFLAILALAAGLWLMSPWILNQMDSLLSSLPR